MQPSMRVDNDDMTTDVTTVPSLPVLGPDEAST
jgi:hypothetical protein